MYVYVCVYIYIYTRTQNCCIYTAVPPDDDQKACSKHVEVNY